MKKIIIVFLVLLFLTVSFSGCLEKTEDENKYLLYKEIQPGEQYHLSITQEMIDTVGSNKCEDVFASLGETEGLVVFWYDMPDDGQPDGTWKPSRQHNTFNTVNSQDKYVIGLNAGENPVVLKIPNI